MVVIGAYAAGGLKPRTYIGWWLFGVELSDGKGRKGQSKGRVFPMCRFAAILLDAGRGQLLAIASATNTVISSMSQQYITIGM